jgi:hypothetical protein
MDDDRLHADVAEVRDVGRERVLELLRHHGIAAVLDHDDLIAESPQPGQRLDQGRRLEAGLVRIGLLDLCHDE